MAVNHISYKFLVKSEDLHDERPSVGEMCNWLIGQVQEGHCKIDIGDQKPKDFCNKCLSCVLKGEAAAVKICGPKKGTDGKDSYHGCMIEQVNKLNCPKECGKSNAQAYQCALNGGIFDNGEDLHDKRPSVGEMCNWLIGQVQEDHCKIDIGDQKPKDFCNKCLSCVLKGEAAAVKICGPKKGTDGKDSYHGCMIEQVNKLNCPKECGKSNAQAYQCALNGGIFDNGEDLHDQSPDVRNHECELNENKFRKMLAKPVNGHK